MHIDTSGGHIGGKNETYPNTDIDIDRSHLNVNFKRCEGTYLEAFDRMVADGTISTGGLGDDPKIWTKWSLM